MAEARFLTAEVGGYRKPEEKLEQPDGVEKGTVTSRNQAWEWLATFIQSPI